MKNLLKITLAAIMFCGLASCSNDDNPPSGGDGKISIRIAGDPASQGSRHAAGDALVDESLVTSYFICIYDYASGNCERVVIGDPDHVTVIEGLSTATQKRVFVLANYPVANQDAISVEISELDYESFSELRIPGSMMWSSSLIEEYGLMMVGESESAVTLSSTQTTEVTVHIKRLMAKVTLGDITLSDESGLDPSKFVLESVSIQRINSVSSFLLDDYVFYDDSTPAFFGGIQGTISQAGSGNTEYLNDISIPSPAVDTPYTFGNYFYVTRNNGTLSSTLICLTAKYDGVTYYYPVIVNPPAGGNTTGTTGDYIESNHQYRVNITIKNPVGTNDPDTPITSADLEVTIVVDPWELEIVQNSEI